MPKTASKRKELSPWDRTYKRTLTRSDTLTGNMIALEKGVNFFVLGLEKLGAKSLFSCEGHPSGFYIKFHGSYQTALAVNAMGYFRVEVAGHNLWCMRLREKDWTEREKRQVLRWAAVAWNKRLNVIEEEHESQ